MKIVQVNNTSYAVDLWWQTRPQGAINKRAMRKLAQQTAQRDAQDSNCVALRAQQYGLGQCVLPIPRKVSSLAASITPPATQWIGIFNLAEGWWVCSVSQGSISADGDKIFSHEEAAQDHAARLRNLFDTCLETSCRTREESLGWLTTHLGQHDGCIEALNLSEQKHEVKRFAFIGLCAAFLISGGWYAYTTFEERKTALALRTLMQGKEQQRQAILATPEQHFNRPWTERPLLTAQADQCMAHMLALPLSDNGWLLEGAGCSQRKLVVHWQHRTGASFLQLPHHARFTSPKQVTATHSLPALPHKAKAPSQKRALAEAALYELTQTVGVKLTLKWTPPERKTINDIELVAPWLTGTWVLSQVPASVMLSKALFQDLEALGCVLDSMLYDQKNQHWTLRGRLYALAK